MARRRTFEEFKILAEEKHNGSYEYDESTYKNDKTPMRMICPIHGEFMRSPKHHLLGQGCPICGREKAKVCHKFNYNKFIKRFIKKYGEEFEFPYIKDEYENKHSIITYKCLNCGKVHKQKAQNIFANKYGCRCKIPKKAQKPKVKKEPKEIKSKLIDKNTILKRIYEKWSTVECVDISNYKNTNTKLIWKCKICDRTFPRKANHFLYGYLKNPCPHCTLDKIRKEHTKTQEQFERDVYNKYGKEKYTVVGKYISSSDTIDIQCNECGRIFNIEANSFLQGHGCPYHSDITSKLEKDIEQLLTDNNISFMKWKKFPWLKYKNKLSLDFYIPSCNIAIECQGKQHFENVDYFGGLTELNERKNRDRIKKELCDKHNIKLLYYANYQYDFPYKVYENKEEILNIIKEKYDENNK